MHTATRISLAFAAALSFAPTALATESDATTCLGTKVQSEYADGWSLRTSQAFTLGPGEHKVFKVRVLQGNEYRLQACGDDASLDLDIVVYDGEGNEVARDPADGGAPLLDLKPGSTGAYLVVVHAAQLAEGATGSGIAFGISYR